MHLNAFRGAGCAPGDVLRVALVVQVRASRPVEGRASRLGTGRADTPSPRSFATFQLSTPTNHGG